MRSGVVPAAPTPFDDLLMSMRPTARGSAGGAARSAGDGPKPLLLVVGADRAGRGDVLDALLGHVSGASEPAPAWRVYRGSDPRTRKLAPAGPPMGGAGPSGADARSARDSRRASRPARRADIECSSRLLDSVTIVDAPELDARSGAVAELVLDVADGAAGVLYLVDCATPLRADELDLLAGLAERARPCAFVLTGAERRRGARPVVAANRALLRSRVAPLARAPWFVLPAGAALSPALRALLRQWAGAAPATVSDVRPAVDAVTVSGDADCWSPLIEAELRTSRLAAAERVAIDLATAHVRGMQEMGSGLGCPGVPYVLDRELHALSVRVSRQLELDADRAIDRLGRCLLGAAWRDGEPAEAVRRRIASAARRTVDTLDDREPDRTLMLTATCGVAVVTGHGPLDALFAVRLSERPVGLFTPLGLALTANCYTMWRGSRDTPGEARAGDKAACRRWLRQALTAVETEVVRELGHRYSALHRALSIIAGDAVDHGILLA